MRMKHSRFCTERTKRFKEDIREFTNKYPSYCKKCRGTGYLFYDYDPSPAGVSLSSGYMTDCDPCDECLEMDICPLCGGACEFNENLGHSICVSDKQCQWIDIGDSRYIKEEQIIAPEEPDCDCWYEWPEPT